VISHFNLFRSTSVQGTGAPGVSSGEALRRCRMWPGRSSLRVRLRLVGQAFQEVKAGSQAGFIFALSILIVYLVLAAQYES